MTDVGTVARSGTTGVVVLFFELVSTVEPGRFSVAAGGVVPRAPAFDEPFINMLPKNEWVGWNFVE